MFRCRRIALILVALVGCAGELTPAAPGEDDSPSPDAGEAVEMVFRPRVQADLAAAGCTAGSACHGGTIAPMPLVASPQTDAEWRANYDQISARAGTPGSSLLIDKATGAGGHVAPLTATNAVIEGWNAWIATGAPYEVNDEAPGADAGPTGPDTGAQDDALTWTDDVEPLLRANGCMDCHGNSGAYSLESYSAALGFGTDGTPNVVPGDASSLLATYCEQGHFDMTYADALQVLSWIVDWGARER